MYEVYGLNTRKIYVTGSRSDCSRHLINLYPYQRGNGNQKGKALNQNVLPEPLMIRRVAGGH